MNELNLSIGIEVVNFRGPLFSKFSKINGSCILAIKYTIVALMYFSFIFKLINLFTSQMLSSLLVSLPRVLHSTLLHFISERVLHYLHPLSHGIPFPGASSLDRIRYILSHWGQTRYLLCYICVWGLWPAHVFSLVGGLVSGNFRVPG